MRRLPIPTDDVGGVFQDCISRVRNKGLKQRLASVEVNVVQESEKFAIAATKGTLDRLTPQAKVGGVVTVDEMIAVYSSRMARKNAPGRHVYDKLIAAPINDICPLCGTRTVSTLDHHLPKASFPALAVTPINLVPACSDCNRAKLNTLISRAEEQTIHPYFDDVEDEPWLAAEVIVNDLVSVRFFVDPPGNWDVLKKARVEFHFRVLELAALYAAHAAEELAGIRFQLNLNFEQGGKNAVQAHLAEQADSRESSHVNSWQTAFYKAAAAHTEYCSGGFARI